MGINVSFIPHRDKCLIYPWARYSKCIVRNIGTNVSVFTFSKVVPVVTLYSKCTRVLTFKNFARYTAKCCDGTNSQKFFFVYFKKDFL
jgi:hypothetical protein